MEAPNQFQLELAIDGYLAQLQTGGNYSSEDILELRSHLIENVDELKQKKLSTEEAFIIAKKRLGKEEELAREYNKVNGVRFSNRDLFITVLSICTFLFLYYFYNLVTGAVGKAVYFKAVNPFILGLIKYSFQLLYVALVLYMVINCKKYYTWAEKRFIKSPSNFAAVSITILVTVYLFFYFSPGFFNGYNGLSVFERQSRYDAFNIDNELSSTFFWLIPCIWMLSIFFAFTNSYKKIKFLNYIINETGYLALFLIGVFWDFIAAVSRTYNTLFHNYETGKSILFALFWLAGMLIFNLHVKKNILTRNLFFLAFGVIMEFAAGMWMNPKLRDGLPVSIYFIALIIGAAAGYIIARVIKKKSTKIAISG
jgi:hypothetical protein